MPWVPPTSHDVNDDFKEHGAAQIRLRRVTRWFCDLDESVTRSERLKGFWRDLGAVKKPLYLSDVPVDHDAVDAIMRRAKNLGYKER